MRTAIIAMIVALYIYGVLVSNDYMYKKGFEDGISSLNNVEEENGQATY